MRQEEGMRMIKGVANWPRFQLNDGDAINPTGKANPEWTLVCLIVCDYCSSLIFKKADSGS